MPFLAQADRRDAMSEFVKPITLASMRANASWKCRWRMHAIGRHHPTRRPFELAGSSDDTVEVPGSTASSETLTLAHHGEGYGDNIIAIYQQVCC